MKSFREPRQARSPHFLLAFQSPWLLSSNSARKFKPESMSFIGSIWKGPKWWTEMGTEMVDRNRGTAMGTEMRTEINRNGGPKCWWTEMVDRNGGPKSFLMKKQAKTCKICFPSNRWGGRGSGTEMVDRNCWLAGDLGQGIFRSTQTGFHGLTKISVHRFGSSSGAAGRGCGDWELNRIKIVS